MTAQQSGLRPVLCILLALVLVLGCSYPLTRGWADEIEDAKSAVDEAQAAVDSAQAAAENAQMTLDAAEAQMSQLTQDYDNLQGQARALQEEIDSSLDQLFEAQGAMLEGRNALGQTMMVEYRSGTTAASVISVLLGSSNFEELLRNIEYLSAIMDHQAQEVADQKERKEQFEAISQTLSEKKDEQMVAINEIEEKQAQAQAIADAAYADLSNAQVDVAARMEALQEQVDKLAYIEQEHETVEISPDANTGEHDGALPSDEEAPPASDTPASQPSFAGPSDESSGWLSGVASAYGGSSDPSTPNPGTTATGAVCDDSSMGVAIPMSLPNYRSYLGRTVEISYNGMTVYATVNDCGYMGGGSRALDLQPGVFKALGFNDCYAWGVRTVNYRFL